MSASSFCGVVSKVSAGGARQAYSAHFLQRLHDNNGSGGVDQDFQTIESIHHQQNVEC